MILSMAFIFDNDWTWIRYSKRNDILKFLKNFIDLEKDNHKIIKPKTYEMLADNYHQFENTFHKTNQDDKDLSLLFNKLLDFPVRFSFNRYHRVVQEIAKNLGKKIDFKITGEQGSMSKSLLNTIHDAMIHLIRNSLDHGIEAPETRITKGKKEKGTIEIMIKSIGENKLQIKVKDDGKGIDINRVCKNAVERDLMSSKKIEDLTNEEKLQLIFLPNLSTKQNVTEISGRGVGLDVVKKIIDSLGANLTINTKLDQGTEFIIEI